MGNQLRANSVLAVEGRQAHLGYAPITRRDERCQFCVLLNELQNTLRNIDHAVAGHLSLLVVA
jgi:hypothetical protein